MSQPALSDLPFELVFSDGEPLESEWHVHQMYLLMEVLRQAMAEQGRSDFHIGGDNFVYYSFEQARDVARGRPYFRGPDTYWVGDVKPGIRKGWVAWEEGGRLPDLIVELLSPSTAKIDRTVKKDLYARVFRTREYYLYEPETQILEGYRLEGATYRTIAADPEGRLWSEQLGAALGPWRGIWSDYEEDWIRLFRADGTLVPTKAEAEYQRAEAERQRAEAAAAELARLRALLERQGQR
jgi:Uma2 family endonuclease